MVQGSHNRQEDDDEDEDEDDLYKAKSSYPFVEGVGQGYNYPENRDMVRSRDNLKEII